MSMFRLVGLSLRARCIASRTSIPVAKAFRPTFCQLRGQLQTRAQHNNPQRRQPRSFRQQQASRSPQVQVLDEVGESHFPNVRVRYLRPAIWALAVSIGIYTGCAYLEARSELKTKDTSGGWLPVPQFGAPNRGPPGPMEVATGAWTSLDPISKTTYGLIAANSAVHLSSFVAPQFWNTLWQ
jgi:rhomboid-like protein